MLTKVLGLCLISAGIASTAGADLRELVRKSLAAMTASEARLSDYGFVRYGERKEFHSDGSLKTSHVVRVRREMRDGFMISRPIERNGQPITGDEQKKVEEAIARRLAEIKAQSPAQIQKAAEERKRKEQEEDAWIQEIPEALDFKIAGEEIISGRAAYVIDCSPRPGYQPRNLRARIFQKLRGRLWLDKIETELIRADAEVFEDVSVALGLAGRVDKGTRFHLERAKVADGVWMPTYQQARFSARILLFKSLNTEVVSRYSDYVRLRNAVQASAR